MSWTSLRKVAEAIAVKESHPKDQYKGKPAPKHAITLHTLNVADSYISRIVRDRLAARNASHSVDDPTHVHTFV